MVLATSSTAGRASGSTGLAVSLLWYRKGLRVHDSPALVAACAGASAVYPVFCLDPWFISSGRVGPVRLRFLAEALADLDASLRERGSRLIVLRGKPELELPRVAKEWGATRLVWESDGVEPYAIERDAAVRAAVEPLGVAVTETGGHTLCDLDQLLAESNGAPVTAYASFQKHFAKVVSKSPITLAPTPEHIPPPARLATAASTTGDKAGGPGGPEEPYAVPTLAEVAPSLAEAGPSIFPGGEREALRRLDAHLSRGGGSWAAAFEKPKTSPTEVDPFGAATRSTTVLSPYLKFGCLSARAFWLRLRAATAGARARSEPPVSLEGQLLWREFYYACAKAVGPRYGRMAGNPICRQVPWRQPAADPAAKEALAAWRKGRTGFPWIDACMRQLASEGWLHHLARHAVACFLTRGDLWLSWEEGAAVFDELLIDADWCLNNGNWMWLSCSCFFYQYFRCYSPVAFGKKYDPDGRYIRRYVPELATFPAKYIYEPWRAPIADQKTAGCRIGVDYPKPIVVHETVSKENMGRMAEAYKAHNEGASASGGKPAPTAGGGGAASKGGSKAAGAAGSAKVGPSRGAMPAGGSRKRALSESAVDESS